MGSGIEARHTATRTYVGARSEAAFLGAAGRVAVQARLVHAVGVGRTSSAAGAGVLDHGALAKALRASRPLKEVSWRLC